MASRNNHLDATAGREVVYCHRCSHEWFKDERADTLDCPRCHDDITEIVSPENDPRDMNEGNPFGTFRNRPPPLYHDADEDPDEDDIEEHIHQGPRGVFGRRIVYGNPEGPSQGNRNRPRPDEGTEIFQRFQELVGTLGGPIAGRTGRGAPHAGGPRPQHVTYQRFSGPGFSGGVSSFTITTGGIGRGGGSEPRMGQPDDFQRIFGHILGDVGPPSVGRESPNAADRDGGGNRPGPPGDLSTALHQLLATVLNPNAIHGDAVYSQEALDRIITNLMEANPQSNAPAPATEDAIARLPRRKLDEAMLGPELKGECTICIDELKLGDEVVVLPCKHWFHDECVVLWLKQHNTCPICRASIDGSAAGQPGAASTSSGSGAAPLPSPQPSAAERRRSNIRQRADVRVDSIRDLGNNYPYDRRQTPRRDSNSPPMPNPPGGFPRVRSPSPSRRQSTQSEGVRDNRGSSSSGPLHWLRDQFSRDRRS